MQPIVSIIIPVYNAELYLRQCLESVISQTYTNWECLLVDDGSKDTSGAICDEYIKKDTRFRVFHKENGGVSSARNTGIENMLGEWVMFVDSDDYLPSSAINDLLASVIVNNCDISFGNYLKVNTDDTQIPSNTCSVPRLLSIEEILTLFFDYPVGHFQGYLWNRLMRTSIIVNQSLRFNESIYYKEDGLFLITYLLNSKKHVAFIPEVVYHYIIRPTGAMQSAHGKYNYKYLTNLDARIEIYSLIKSSNLNENIIKLAKESIYDVVRIILSRRPKEISSCLYVFKYISIRLYKSNMVTYVLYRLSKKLIYKCINLSTYV